VSQEIKVIKMELVGAAVKGLNGRTLQWSQRCRAHLADGTEAAVTLTARCKKQLPGQVASWEQRASYDRASGFFALRYGI
jgi:hypothetical protein